MASIEDCDAAAAEAGLRRREVQYLPANNQLVTWERVDDAESEEAPAVEARGGSPSMKGNEAPAVRPTPTTTRASRRDRKRDETRRAPWLVRDLLFFITHG